MMIQQEHKNNMIYLLQEEKDDINTEILGFVQMEGRWILG